MVFCLCLMMNTQCLKMISKVDFCWKLPPEKNTWTTGYIASTYDRQHLFSTYILISLKMLCGDTIRKKMMTKMKREPFLFWLKKNDHFCTSYRCCSTKREKNARASHNYDLNGVILNCAKFSMDDKSLQKHQFAWWMDEIEFPKWLDLSPSKCQMRLFEFGKCLRQPNVSLAM